MSATVTAKLNLDASGFTAALTRAQASLGRLKAVGVPALAAGFAAASAAAAGLAVGVKGAIDLGAALDDLSMRTGVSAGKLSVLQEAFKLAGLSADQVGPVINKLQKGIAEAATGAGPAAEAMKRLGLTTEQLAALPADRQLEAIGSAINNISDPTQRAAAAMALFGRSGGELLQLFSSAGIMGEASEIVGSQAQLLERNAAIFARAGDTLDSVGTKLRGFFVGVADQLVPALMPLLESARGLDLAGIGQSIGQGLSFGLAAITSGQIGELLSVQFKLAGSRMINDLVNGFQGLVAFFAAAMLDIPQNFVAFIMEGLPAAAMKFAAIINRVVATMLEAIASVPGLGGAAGMASGLRDNASALDQAAAAPLASFTDRIADTIAKSLDAAGAALANSTETIDTTALVAAQQRIIGSIDAEMARLQAEGRAAGGAGRTASPFDPEALGAGAGRNTGIIAQSLQKVGGGGAFARFSDAANPAAQAVREQQKTNRVLEKYLPLLDRFAPQPTLMPS